MLWLLRHAEAVDGLPDDDRPLTEQRGPPSAGRGPCTRASRGSDRRLPVEPQTSRAPDRRARMRAARGRGDGRARLSGEPFDVADLVAGLDDVLLVGHDPSFTLTLHDLTGAQARISKGGLAAVEKGELIALLRPTELAAIGGYGAGRMTDTTVRTRHDVFEAAGPQGQLAVPQPRAVMDRLQRSRAAARRGRVAAADGAAEVPGDLRRPTSTSSS